MDASDASAGIAQPLPIIITGKDSLVDCFRALHLRAHHLFQLYTEHSAASSSVKAKSSAPLLSWAAAVREKYANYHYADAGPLIFGQLCKPSPSVLLQFMSIYSAAVKAIAEDPAKIDDLFSAVPAAASGTGKGDSFSENDTVNGDAKNKKEKTELLEALHWLRDALENEVKTEEALLFNLASLFKARIGVDDSKREGGGEEETTNDAAAASASSEQGNHPQQQQQQKEEDWTQCRDTFESVYRKTLFNVNIRIFLPDHSPALKTLKSQFFAKIKSKMSDTFPQCLLNIIDDSPSSFSAVVDSGKKSATTTKTAPAKSVTTAATKAKAVAKAAPSNATTHKDERQQSNSTNTAYPPSTVYPPPPLSSAALNVVETRKSSRRDSELSSKKKRCSSPSSESAASSPSELDQKYDTFSTRLKDVRSRVSTLATLYKSIPPSAPQPFSPSRFASFANDVVSQYPSLTLPCLVEKNNDGDESNGEKKRDAVDDHQSSRFSYFETKSFATLSDLVAFVNDEMNVINRNGSSFVAEQNEDDNATAAMESEKQRLVLKLSSSVMDISSPARLITADPTIMKHPYAASLLPYANVLSTLVSDIATDEDVAIDLCESIGWLCATLEDQIALEESFLSGMCHYDRYLASKRAKRSVGDGVAAVASAAEKNDDESAAAHEENATNENEDDAFNRQQHVSAMAELCAMLSRRREQLFPHGSTAETTLMLSRFRPHDASELCALQGEALIAIMMLQGQTIPRTMPPTADKSKNGNDDDGDDNAKSADGTEAQTPSSSSAAAVCAGVYFPRCLFTVMLNQLGDSIELDHWASIVRVALTLPPTNLNNVDDTTTVADGKMMKKRRSKSLSSHIACLRSGLLSEDLLNTADVVRAIFGGAVGGSKLYARNPPIVVSGSVFKERGSRGGGGRGGVIDRITENSCRTSSLITWLVVAACASQSTAAVATASIAHETPSSSLSAPSSAATTAFVPFSPLYRHVARVLGEIAAFRRSVSIHNKVKKLTLKWDDCGEAVMHVRPVVGGGRSSSRPQAASPFPELYRPLKEMVEKDPLLASVAKYFVLPAIISNGGNENTTVSDDEHSGDNQNDNVHYNDTLSHIPLATKIKFEKLFCEAEKNKKTQKGSAARLLIIAILSAAFTKAAPSPPPSASNKNDNDDDNAKKSDTVADCNNTTTTTTTTAVDDGDAIVTISKEELQHMYELLFATTDRSSLLKALLVQNTRKENVPKKTPTSAAKNNKKKTKIDANVPVSSAIARARQRSDRVKQCVTYSGGEDYDYGEGRSSKKSASTPKITVTEASLLFQILVTLPSVEEATRFVVMCMQFICTGKIATSVSSSNNENDGAVVSSDNCPRKPVGRPRKTDKATPLPQQKTPPTPSTSPMPPPYHTTVRESNEAFWPEWRFALNLALRTGNMPLLTAMYEVGMITKSFAGLFGPAAQYHGEVAVSAAKFLIHTVGFTAAELYAAIGGGIFVWNDLVLLEYFLGEEKVDANTLVTFLSVAEPMIILVTDRANKPLPAVSLSSASSKAALAAAKLRKKDLDARVLYRVVGYVVRNKYIAFKKKKTGVADCSWDGTTRVDIDLTIDLPPSSSSNDENIDFDDLHAHSSALECEFIALLLKYNADVNATCKDVCGRTALDFAQQDVENDDFEGDGSVDGLLSANRAKKGTPQKEKQQANKKKTSRKNATNNDDDDDEETDSSSEGDDDSAKDDKAAKRAKYEIILKRHKFNLDTALSATMANPTSEKFEETMHILLTNGPAAEVHNILLKHKKTTRVGWSKKTYTVSTVSLLMKMLVTTEDKAQAVRILKLVFQHIGYGTTVTLKYGFLSLQPSHRLYWADWRIALFYIFRTDGMLDALKLFHDSGMLGKTILDIFGSQRQFDGEVTVEVASFLMDVVGLEPTALFAFLGAGICEWSNLALLEHFFKVRGVSPDTLVPFGSRKEPFLIIITDHTDRMSDPLEGSVPIGYDKEADGTVVANSDAELDDRDRDRLFISSKLQCQAIDLIAECGGNMFIKGSEKRDAVFFAKKNLRDYGKDGPLKCLAKHQEAANAAKPGSVKPTAKNALWADIDESDFDEYSEDDEADKGTEDEHLSNLTKESDPSTIAHAIAASARRKMKRKHGDVMRPSEIVDWVIDMIEEYDLSWKRFNLFEIRRDLMQTNHPTADRIVRRIEREFRDVLTYNGRVDYD